MPEEISAQNPKVKLVRGLLRDRRKRLSEGCFVVDTPTVIDEALTAGRSVRFVLVADDLAAEESTRGNRIRQTVDHCIAEGVSVNQLDQANFVRLSDAKTPQGILAVVEGGVGSVAELASGLSFVMVVVDLNDPGNAGTIVRTALANGADAVVALGESVDFTNPKTLRASAGAMLRLPVAAEPHIDQGLDELTGRGLTLVGAAGEAELSCFEVDLTGPIAIVLGAEAHGLDPSLRQRLDRLVKIPMVGEVESLNVGVAGAVLGYERTRQVLAARS